MKGITISVWRIISPVLVALLFAAGTANAREAGMMGTSVWTATCNGNNLTHWDNMVRSWYNRIDDFGWYQRDKYWVDGSFSKNAMCDPDRAPGCIDGIYLDEVDAVMVFGHGADAGDHWAMINRNKGADGSCWIRHPGAGSTTGRMLAGDYDLEFLHISSCNSGDDDNLSLLWTAFRDPVDTPNNQRRLHQANVFHGWMWIGSSLDSNYRNFARDAHFMSIRSAWLYNHHENNISGNMDQCPVSYAVGSNQADCFNRLHNERYNYVFSDPSAIGYYCYSYFAGCDPGGETTFGQDYNN